MQILRQKKQMLISLHECTEGDNTEYDDKKKQPVMFSCEVTLLWLVEGGEHWAGAGPCLA